MAPKVMEVILVGYINVRLRKLQNDREDELVSALSGSNLVDVIAHFTPRQRYQGTRGWTW